MPLILDHPVLTPWMSSATRRNPGVQPLHPDDWLQRDACFADQMALRDDLIANNRQAVFSAQADMAAAQEVLQHVLSQLDVEPARTIRRADGVDVAMDDHPLICAARLVQEDLLILSPQDGQWVLSAGVLCFPSHWILAEKLGRPLDLIHAPVPFYAGDLARRVQRIFDAIRVEQPLWRANWLLHPNADLHAPRRADHDKPVDWSAGLFVRVERQSLVKLPTTGAVLFTIKTDICPLHGLSADQRAGLLAAFDGLPPAQRAYKGGDQTRAQLVGAGRPK